MAVTDGSFRDAFPAFKDAAKFPAPQVAFYLALGPKLHNAERWDELLDFGVMLFTAHNLSVEYEATRQAAAGQNPGGVRGSVTSMSAAGVSWARDPGPAMDPRNGHWNLSSYGLRWVSLANLVGAGPVQVGTPGPDEAAASAYGAWGGPFT